MFTGGALESVFDHDNLRSHDFMAQEESK